MPMKKKTTSAPRRRVGGRRSAPRRRMGARVALPKRNTGNFASVTETYSGAATAGVVYDFTAQLSSTVTPRSAAVAVNYQYYRCTQIEMRFKPLSDTFQAGGSANLPYLFFQYDKSGALEGTLDAAGFEAIGTKAIRLDDKTLVRKWKPSVLQDTDSALVNSFKVSPWLPVLKPGTVTAQLNAPPHYGCTFYISKQNPADATNYDIDIVMTFQFRKPMVVPRTGGESTKLPIIVQGNQSAVDLSLNPLLSLGH